ncbi:Mce family protein [Rhodococcus sp. RD6.2]|uniref:MCE family protein n=1 Tax=Rhodococcus sp. RD6.2 TaxID=260936 RepID=UPI00063B4A68|nr:MCE family protein [Rhodococcus sp. RD6.2]CRK49336.1 Mce family protein [Rhodococcus sp. RD6.2]
MRKSSTDDPGRRVRRTWLVIGAGLAALLAISYAVVPRVTSIVVEAEFTSTTGLYPGDDVRVMGVTVGRVESIEPGPEANRVRMRVERSQPIPADADAIIVSQSLVAARFVQLAPAYTGGDTLSDGALISLSHTAVPVEWDQMTEQLDRLAAALGPEDTGPDGENAGPAGELVDALDATLDGQGDDLHSTLIQLSDAMRILSDGRTDLFATVRNLQVFVAALARSDQQIVEFNTRMATVSEVLDSNTDTIGSAITTLDTAVGEVTRFVRDNRDAVGTTAEQLSDVLANLAAQRDGITQILHVAPTALANMSNIYQPAQNAVVSALAPNNFANPVDFICSALAAAEQVGAERGAELCVQYLGPVLTTLAVDYLPLQANPMRGVTALPGQVVQSGAPR